MAKESVEDLKKQVLAKRELEDLRAQVLAKRTAESTSAQSRPLADRVETAARSSLEGLTFGVTEPIISAGNAVGSKVADWVYDLPVKESYSDAYDRDVARRRELKDQNSVEDIGGNMFGALLPAIATGGTSAVAKGLTALPRAVNATGNLVGRGARLIPGAAEFLNEGKTLASSAARIVEGGANAAAQNVASEVVRQNVEEASGHLKEGEAPSLIDVAKTGAIFGGALSSLPEIAMQGGRIAKGATRVLTGVTGEAIDKYLANPEAIRNAPTIEALKDEMDVSIKRLTDDVANAKISKEEAQQALKEAKLDLKQKVGETKLDLRQSNYEIGRKFDEAKTKLDTAFKAAKDEVKSARLPLQVDDVLDSVEKVKQQVIESSAESYKILDAHPGNIKVTGIKKSIQGMQNALKVDGKLMSKDSQDAHAVLDRWLDNISGIDGKLAKPATIKATIQEIDSELRTASDRMAGGFSEKTEQVLFGLRKALDSQIKNQVAGYSEIMEVTSELAKKRAILSKLFGKRESVTAKLARIDKPASEFERNTLKELGTLTGKDFTSPLDELVNTKMKGRSDVALQELKKGLPENEEYIQALAEKSRATRPEYAAKILGDIQTASPEADALRMAETKMGQANEGLQSATAAQAPYSRISPQNSENLIRSMMGDKTRKIEVQRMLKSFGEASDQDFIQLIDDMRIKEGFEKGFRNGSSNVNLWGILSGALGFVTGGAVGAAAFGGAGAGLGKVIDAYGPKMTKKVLDGMIYMRGVPTIKKIESAFGDLPPELLSQLKADLVRAASVGLNTPTISIPQDQRQDFARDFLENEDMGSVERAKAINDINKKGIVSAQRMQKLMLGSEKPEPAQMQPSKRQAAPNISQVSDFVKNRKPEEY